MDKMPIENLSSLDASYLPFMITYRDLHEDADHCLLVFAGCAKDAAELGHNFLVEVVAEFLMLSVSFINVQYTLVQREEQWQSTDELDDPIRQ